MEDVIILGTGCAGLTAAIYTGRAQLNPLVLEGTQPGGQLTTTSEVENFPGFPEGIDGFMMMDNLRKQAARFGARYEHAKVLTRFCSKVTMIHRRGELRASQIMADRATSHEKIEMAWNTSPIEVLADDKGFCRAIRVQDTVTSEEREIPCKGVFIAIGHIPNTDFVENLLERDGDGYIVTEPSSQVKTKYAGFYAAGDCVDHVYRQAITAAGMGCQAAIEAERWLAERES